MTLKETRAKIKLFRRRRGHLKAALRKDAKFFDMTLWFLGGTEETRKLEKGILNDASLPSPERKRIFKNYEQCGTACCIAGLDFLRSGRKLKEIVEFYGFAPKYRGLVDDDSHLFYSQYWPQAIVNKYFKAKYNKDHTAMAEAGCEAIDYFGKEQDKYLLSIATAD